jgi:hypothetical protein
MVARNEMTRFQTNVIHRGRIKARNNTSFISVADRHSEGIKLEIVSGYVQVKVRSQVIPGLLSFFPPPQAP